MGSSIQNTREDNSESQTPDNQNSSTSSRSTNEDSSISPTLLSNTSPSTSSFHPRANPEPGSMQETSIKDLKAAVENIQKLFSIHLMESQQDNDDT